MEKKEKKKDTENSRAQNSVRPAVVDYIIRYLKMCESLLDPLFNTYLINLSLFHKKWIWKVPKANVNLFIKNHKKYTFPWFCYTSAIHSFFSFTSSTNMLTIWEWGPALWQGLGLWRWMNYGACVWAQCNHLWNGSNYNEEDRNYYPRWNTESGPSLRKGEIKFTALYFSSLCTGPTFPGSGNTISLVRLFRLLLFPNANSLFFPPAAKGEVHQGNYWVAWGKGEKETTAFFY